MNDVMICKGGRDTPPIECINSYSKKWALRVCFEELEDNVVKYYEKQINSDVEPSEEDRLSFEREVLRSCFNKCYTSGFEFKETRIPISEYLNSLLLMSLLKPDFEYPIFVFDCNNKKVKIDNQEDMRDLKNSYTQYFNKIIKYEKE